MPVNYKVGGTNFFDNNYVRREFFGEGNLWNWGYNSYGQLGNNASTDLNSPVQTIAGGINWKDVAVGAYHTAGIKTDGSLWMWGGNIYGQLGINNTVHRSSPVQTISGGNNWKSVSAGYYHTAAIKTNGTLWAWGYNPYGELGTGNQTNRSSPVQVGTGAWWKYVSLGRYTTTAIKSDGTLWVWGFNAVGQLGTNDTTNYSSPVQTASGGTNWKQVSTGVSITAAIKTDGTLWTWGLNQEGYLGLGFANYPGLSTPTQVGSDTTWKQISAGDRAMASVKTDGSLWVWGSGIYNNLGMNDSNTYSSPVQMSGMGWKMAAMGERQGGGGALKSDGTLWTWGYLTTGNGSHGAPAQLGTASDWKLLAFNGSSGRQAVALSYTS